MRIAFVDLVFAWPPPGGAQADLYYTMLGLQKLGHEVRLFATCYHFLWRFNEFDPDDLPFPSTPVWITEDSYNCRAIPARFRKEVDAWKPDAVFIGLGRYLKPYVIDALAHYPVISRYYMYEHLCLRDFCLFRFERTCPNDLFETPNVCRSCAAQCWRKDISSGKPTTYSHEYLRTRAYTRAFHRLFVESMGKVRLAIVNNDLAKGRLEGRCADVRIIPGGVNLAEIHTEPPREKGPDERKVILLSGRTDDRRKGVDVMLEAGQALSRVRNDFEVWVTQNEQDYDHDWLNYVGWHNHSEIMALYGQADICVVPSVWEEPFGLVAIEGMAAYLPVCASRVGGLKGIVQDKETGLLFEAGDSAELALHLNRLLDDPALRKRMGEAGRRRVEAEYDWDVIVPEYYPNLLEEIAG